MNISIIIPVKDRSTYIQNTLKSIQRSPLQPREIIIVDNGSKDDTLSVCKRMASKYSKDAHGFPYITIVEENTQGAAAARNKGLELCKTEWVYFFDSDDEFDEDLLPTLSALKSQGMDMICFPTNQVIKGETRTRTFIAEDSPKVQILSSSLNTVSMVFRTDFVRKIGGWNNECKIWDDWELGVRAMCHKPQVLWYTDKAFHNIYIHEDSITGANFSSRYEHIVTALEITTSNMKNSPHMTALYYRTAIIIGKISKEKHVDSKIAVNALNNFVCKKFTPTKVEKRWFCFLKTYSRLGGRGAWRIALYL